MSQESEFPRPSWDREFRCCRPFFIGLLGERYGWTPQPEEIPADLLEREEWLKDHHNHSVTELEIIHGVLREEEMHSRAFFYFRDPEYLDRLPEGRNRAHFESESPEDKEKLDQLKQRIRVARDEGVCQLRENYDDLSRVESVRCECAKSIFQRKSVCER